MDACKLLRLDPSRRRKATAPELPGLSAMTGDGVMHFPVERRQAEVHDCSEMHERRRQRLAGGA